MAFAFLFAAAFELLLRACWFELELFVALWLLLVLDVACWEVLAGDCCSFSLLLFALPSDLCLRRFLLLASLAFELLAVPLPWDTCETKFEVVLADDEPVLVFDDEVLRKCVGLSHGELEFDDELSLCEISSSSTSSLSLS